MRDFLIALMTLDLLACLVWLCLFIVLVLRALGVMQ